MSRFCTVILQYLLDGGLKMFNSLKYAKKLEEVGLSREQAEAHIQIMTELIETNLSTKQDMKDLRQDMKDLESSLRQDMKDLRQELIHLEHRLTIKLGTIVGAIIGLAIAFNKLF